MYLQYVMKTKKRKHAAVTCYYLYMSWTLAMTFLRRAALVTVKE